MNPAWVDDVSRPDTPNIAAPAPGQPPPAEPVLAEADTLIDRPDLAASTEGGAARP